MSPGLHEAALANSMKIPKDIYQTGDYQFVAPTSIHLVHRNGHHRIVPLGFCWFGCMLPTIWAMSEGLWRPFALSLIVFLAGQAGDIMASTCQQGMFCNSLTLAGLIRLGGAATYLFCMAYFGLRGKDMLVADLLQHGYFVEGTPYPVDHMQG